MNLPKFPKDVPFYSYTTPAARVCAAFGSANALADLLGLHRSSVLRWNYSSPQGLDGRVPSKHQQRIMELARQRGILLRPEHLIDR